MNKEFLDINQQEDINYILDICKELKDEPFIDINKCYLINTIYELIINNIKNPLK